jgi:hypothetical protein
MPEKNADTQKGINLFDRVIRPAPSFIEARITISTFWGLLINNFYKEGCQIQQILLHNYLLTMLFPEMECTPNRTDGKSYRLNEILHLKH